MTESTSFSNLPGDLAADQAVVGRGTDAPASQALEDQNIFVLLGALKVTATEQEDFLDRLQKTIWDDFLDNDIELLLTQEELKPLEEIITAEDLDEVGKQEKMVAYIEKLIPDLEDILLEKALKLKEDLAQERIAGLTQLVADNEEKMAEMRAIKQLVREGQWATVGERLNTFTIAN
jgi:hypothetical protein